MGFFTAIRVALGALLIHKGRAALTSLGIVIGIAAVTALVSAGDGARLQLDNQMDTLGKNLILVRAGSYKQEVASASSVPLTAADTDAIRREAGSMVLGGVEEVVSNVGVAMAAGELPELNCPDAPR